MNRKMLIAVIAVAAVFLSPLAAAPAGPVELNQFFIQTQDILAGSTTPEEYENFVQSAYQYGLKLMFDPPRYHEFDYNDPKQTFAYLFERFPDYVVVYPTETYYYYSFTLPNITISGNIRLLDARDGKIYIGYFDKSRPHGAVWYTTLTEKDGLKIETLSKYLYKVTYKGKTVTFKLTDTASLPPKQLKLLPEEEFVSRITDESGIRLFLLYNNVTASFYYVLDEENGVAEIFTENGHYRIGQKTGFVFFEDNKRKLLVGVSRENIYWNNWFDGPFDQVPPRLPIKEKLEAAYPYVTYAGGIDEHGNFLGFQKGSRVAISPYLDYVKVSDIISYHNRCQKEENKSAFWSCLTYEWKKDFHRQLGKNTSISPNLHPIFISQGWPANHWGNASRAWPPDHTSEKSSIWPPNHDPEESKQLQK